MYAEDSISNGLRRCLTLISSTNIVYMKKSNYEKTKMNKNNIDRKQEKK